MLCLLASPAVCYNYNYYYYIYAVAEMRWTEPSTRRISGHEVVQCVRRCEYSPKQSNTVQYSPIQSNTVQYSPILDPHRRPQMSDGKSEVFWLVHVFRSVRFAVSVRHSKLPTVRLNHDNLSAIKFCSTPMIQGLSGPCYTASNCLLRSLYNFITDICGCVTTD